MSKNVPTRALVTGATGFIGGHLVRRLHAMGCQVHVIVRNAAKMAALREEVAEGGVHVHDGTMEGMMGIMRSVQPEVVFHVASLFLSQHRTEDVTALVRSNVEFGTQLAEAAAMCNVPRLINTGTSWQHYENAEYNPVNLYAATKQAMADILRYYAESGAFTVTHLELFDTYGPGDARPKLFALLRKAAASGEALAMSGGEQLIDLVYVDDVVEAYVAAMQGAGGEGSRAAQRYAVSSGAPLRLRELVERWGQVTGRKLNAQWGARAYRPREMMQPWTGGELVPGWRAKISLDDGIRRMEGMA